MLSVVVACTFFFVLLYLFFQATCIRPLLGWSDIVWIVNVVVFTSFVLSILFFSRKQHCIPFLGSVPILVNMVYATVSMYCQLSCIMNSNLSHRSSETALSMFYSYVLITLNIWKFGSPLNIMMSGFECFQEVSDFCQFLEFLLAMFMR